MRAARRLAARREARRQRRQARQRQAAPVTWLTAQDVPLPAHPIDPVAFGPPLAADPTDFGRGKEND